MERSRQRRQSLSMRGSQRPLPPPPPPPLPLPRPLRPLPGMEEARSCPALLRWSGEAIVDCKGQRGEEDALIENESGMHGEVWVVVVGVGKGKGKNSSLLA